MKKDRDLQLQPGEEKPQWNLICEYKYLKGGCKENRARMFSVVPSERQWAHTDTQKALYIMKHFFPERVTKHWYMVHRELVEASSLEIFNSHLDTTGYGLVALLEQLGWTR